MKHEIEFVINPEGEVTATVKGIKGASCVRDTQWVEKLGKVTDHRHTDEYNKDRNHLVSKHNEVG